MVTTWLVLLLFIISHQFLYIISNFLNSRSSTFSTRITLISVLSVSLPMNSLLFLQILYKFSGYTLKRKQYSWDDFYQYTWILLVSYILLKNTASSFESNFSHSVLYIWIGPLTLWFLRKIVLLYSRTLSSVKSKCISLHAIVIAMPGKGNMFL